MALEQILIDSRLIVSVNLASTASIDHDILRIYSILTRTENPRLDLPRFRELTLPQIYKGRPSSSTS